MSEEKTAAPDAMALELSRVTTGVESINRIEAGLADLRERYLGVVYEVTTTAGMDMAKEARAFIREPRYEVERIRKAAKAPILALGKQLDAVAARITEAIEKIEAPIHLQITNEEARKEAEKQARIDAEIYRVKALRERVDELRGCQTLTPASGSELIAEHITDLEAIRPDAGFQEFEQEAFTVWDNALTRLRGLHGAAVAHETEQRRLATERAELAKRQAEQAERERVAAEERRKQEAADKAKREAEEKRLADERRENARIAEEQRQANAAEEKRLADQRAELEREQAKLREAQAPRIEPVPSAVPAELVTATVTVKPRVRALPPPPAEQMIDAIEDHFLVDRSTALYWLLSFKTTEVAA
jgi:hypothetical protein